MHETAAARPDGAKKQKNRRRRKFVRKDLQLKIIFGTLFVALIVLVINFQLPIMGMWIMRATSSIWLDTHYNIMIKLLVTSFATSFLLTIPLAVWMGIVFSFQFCGPIYKIKKFFVELNSGRWDRICRLRKGDDLQDVKDVINQYVGLARDRIRSQHEALQEVRVFLETCEKSDQVDSLLAVIAREDAEYTHRLGAVDAAGDQGDASFDEATPEQTESQAEGEVGDETRTVATSESDVTSDSNQDVGADDEVKGASCNETSSEDEDDVKDASDDMESDTEEKAVSTT